MAKHPTPHGGNSNPEAQTVTVPAAAPDERYRKVTLDSDASKFLAGDESKSGVTMNRIDFIRQAWTQARKPRGAISKELTRLTGKKVTYQIIFSATKGVAGGPPQAEQPAPTVSA